MSTVQWHGKYSFNDVPRASVTTGTVTGETEGTETRIGQMNASHTEVAN